MATYCCTCGKIAKCVFSETRHLIPEKAFAICEGPLVSCEPPDAGAFLLPVEPQEMEDYEPTYEDTHIAQIVDTYYTYQLS